MNKTQSVYNYRLEKDVLEAVQTMTECNLAEMTGYELLSECIHVSDYRIDEYGVPEMIVFALFNTKKDSYERKSVVLKYESIDGGLTFENNGKPVTVRSMKSSGMLGIIQELYALKMFVWKFQDVFGVIPDLESIEVIGFREKKNERFDRIRVDTVLETKRSWLIEDGILHIKETETNQWKPVTM